VKRVWIVAVLTVASVTGLGYVHPFGNPRVEAARGLGTLLQGANLPPDAKALLVNQMRGLPLKRDALAHLRPRCSGILAHRTGHRRSPQAYGPLPLGAIVDGAATGSAGQD
jgi:hypothetical protein